MPDPSRPALGLLAAAAAVTIWAGWIVAVRGAVSGPAGLSPADLALLRYGAPALLLAPVWIRLGPLPRGVAVWRVAAMQSIRGDVMETRFPTFLTGSWRRVLGWLARSGVSIWT